VPQNAFGHFDYRKLRSAVLNDHCSPSPRPRTPPAPFLTLFRQQLARTSNTYWRFPQGGEVGDQGEVPAVTRRLTKGIPQIPHGAQIKDHRVTRNRSNLFPIN